MTDPGQDRADVIAEVLQHISSLARELSAVRSRPFGDLRLTGRQVEALFILAHSAEPVTAGDLARRLTVTPGAVTQLLSGLRDCGLVETVGLAGDGRVRIVRLSDSAHAQVESFEQAAVRRLAPRFAALRTSELRALAELLSREQG